MRRFLIAFWCTGILVLQPFVLSAQTELEQLKAEVQTLKGTIQTLLDRINALEEVEKAKAIVPAPPSQPVRPPAPPHVAVTSPIVDRDQMSGDQLAAPRLGNEVIDSDGFFLIPGTEMLARVGGYIKTDFLYDLKNAGDPSLFVTSSIPTSGDRGPRSNVQAKQSRINLELRTDTPLGPFKFYYENDFFGPEGETAFHLRHMYGQVTNFLVGYTFSNFIDPDALPDTLDFEGPGSTVYVTQPQFRFMLPLKAGNSLSFSIEAPTSDAKIPEIEQVPPIVPLSRVPDGTAQWRLEGPKGHVQVSSVFRSISLGSTHLHPSVFGWGVNLTAAWTVHGKDNVMWQGTYGHGISRYIEDTTGLGLDAGFARGPEFVARPDIGTFVSYQHYWRPNLRSAFTYGYLDVQPLYYDTADTFTRSTYLNGNLIWNPFSTVELGAEYMYGWQVLVGGVKADAGRIQVSTKFDFVRMQKKQ